MRNERHPGRRTRRACLSLLACASLVALAACSTSDTASSGVTVASYGGTFQDAQTKAYFDPYAKQSGTKVTGTTGSSYDKLKAMVSSGQVDWDVVSAESSTFVNDTSSHLLQPIDYSTVKADGVPARLKQKYGVGYLTFGLNLAWSKKAFPNGMTPKQFFDPSVKARRALPADPNYTLEFALLGDGVKPADLYPLDVDRAFRALDRIKSQVVAFKDAADTQTLIQQGEVDAAYVPNGRVEDAIGAGANWAYGWDGAVADTEWWVVPKDAPNKAGAMKFINYATSPKPQAAMSNAILYGPTNTKAFGYLDKKRAARLPGNPKNADISVVLDPNWWGKNLSTVKPRWDKWLLNK